MTENRKPNGLTPLAVAQKISGGKLLAELEDALVRVASEVVKSGKAGSVTVKFKVSKPQPDQPLVTVQEAVAISLPGKSGTGAFFFVGEDDMLYSEDPRQAELDFRAVETAPPAQTVRETPAAEQAVREQAN